jgi:hypothetical protein
MPNRALPTTTGQMYADATDDDGGQHDLQDGEVAEKEYTEDASVVGDAALVQEDAEGGTEDDGDQDGVHGRSFRRWAGVRR